MTESVGTASGTPHTTGTEPAAHEAYSFACMKCGHGWEQSYDIEHHVDVSGAPRVVYYTDGERVPSPLTRPTCRQCGGHLVRIMRAGQVSMVSAAAERLYAPRKPQPTTGPAGEPGDSGDSGGDASARRGHHHWHLSDLLHPFQHHRR
ncbi:hypothetical protein [Streptomyces violens]|uniref:hypothetical protein n=1 Tax=Streptomyces violens TaxID=66377 RepID=UPI0004BEB533|nr:hypothetical protein [Streptomyces violens]